jgi:hypothetical protein
MTRGSHLKLVRKGAKMETNLLPNFGGNASKPSPHTLKELMDDFCDKELCKFDGELKPRKHVACVKNVRNLTFVVVVGDR